MGILIEKPGYVDGLTGFENLQQLASIRNQINDDKIKEVMEQVGLHYSLRQKVGEYSLGMKQKLGIAQAIMEDQEILLLDEPFNGLDFSSVQNIRSLLMQLNQQGKTILLTSHHNEDIEILCERVYQMNQIELVK